MSIANTDDLIGLEPHVASAIVDHDEIVASAVHLGETQHLRIVAVAAHSRNQGGVA
jgi:hypothetical protein